MKKPILRKNKNQHLEELGECASRISILKQLCEVCYNLIAVLLVVTVFVLETKYFNAYLILLGILVPACVISIAYVWRTLPNLYVKREKLETKLQQ